MDITSVYPVLSEEDKLSFETRTKSIVFSFDMDKNNYQR